MAYYSDLNLFLQPHPLTGDITFLSDANAVKRALMHIIMMRPYDIPFEPDYHGHIQDLLFELPSDSVSATLQSRIKWAINKLEPRADVEEIDVTMRQDESGYDIRVMFSVLSIIEDQELQFFIERIR